MATMILALVYCSLILLIVYWTFNRSLNNDFILDDRRIVRDMLARKRGGHLGLSREVLRGSLFSLQALKHPQRFLTNMTYERDALLYHDGLGWHSVNLTLHMINSMLVFTLLTFFVSIHVAALGAVFFAVHALTSSAVCPISGRASLMSGMFWLAALISVLIGGWQAFLLAALFTFCAFHSKEDTVGLPIILLVIAAWRF